MRHVRSERSAGRRDRREGGAALLVAVLMLALMATIGFASLETVMRDREVAGNTSRSQIALYAADAGIAASLRVLRDEITSSALATGECIDATVPSENLGNGASYGPDTTDATDPSEICMVSSADPCEAYADSSAEQGALPYFYTVWDIRAQGESAGSSVARVQVTAGRCHAFN